MTPQKFIGKCELEKQKAQDAKIFLTTIFANTKTIELRKLHWDKYGGRILSDVYFDDKKLSDIMIENGFAISYFGDKKNKDWCKED